MKKNKLAFGIEEMLNALDTTKAIDATQDAQTGNPEEMAIAVATTGDLISTPEKAEPEAGLVADDNPQSNADGVNIEDPDKASENTDPSTSDTKISEDDEQIHLATEQSWKEIETKAKTIVYSAEHIQEVEAQLEYQEEVLEESLNTVTDLTQIADVLDNTLPFGGVKQNEVPIIKASVDVVSDSLSGITGPIVISQENFSPSKRYASTKLASETIKETVSKIWDKIVEFITKIGTWVKQQIASFLSGYEARKVKLSVLKDKLKDFNGSNITDEFTNQHVLRSITPPIKTKAVHPFVLSVKDIKEGLLVLENTIKVSSSIILNTLSDLLIKEIDLTSRTNLFDSKSILGNTFMAVKDIPGYTLDSSDYEFYSSNLLPGGANLAAIYPTPAAFSKNSSIEQQISLVSKSKIFLAKDENFTHDIKWDFITDENILVKNINDLISANISTKLFSVRLNELINYNKKFADKISNKVTQEKPQEVAKLVSGLITTVHSLYTSPALKMVSFFDNYFNNAEKFIKANIEAANATAKP